MEVYNIEMEDSLNNEGIALKNTTSLKRSYSKRATSLMRAAYLTRMASLMRVLDTERVVLLMRTYYSRGNLINEAILVKKDSKKKNIFLFEINKNTILKCSRHNPKKIIKR
jgi:hypothetical protein